MGKADWGLLGKAAKIARKMGLLLLSNGFPDNLDN